MTRARGYLVVAAILIAASPVPAAAARNKPRVATETYQMSTGVSLQLLAVNVVSSGCVMGAPGCAEFQLLPRETSFIIDIQDETGLPVAGWMFDHRGRSLGEVCGSRETPFAVPRGPYFRVHITNGTCPGAPHAPGAIVPSVPTTGTITVTLFRAR